MAETDYRKYLVDKPLYEHDPQPVKNRQTPEMTLINKELVPEANYHLGLGWINGMPDPNPHIWEHSHPYDEVIIHWGGDYTVPQVLGGEIEFYIGGQPITFNTTTAIFVPKGVRHGPVIWKKFDFPHVQMALRIGSGDRTDDNGNGMRQEKKGIPEKKDSFDYEQYVVRSPIREAGNLKTTGRQNPTMTYMSNKQVKDANVYIEFGWIWDVPSGEVGSMVHENFEEIVLHVGSDNNNPEDLGADMEFGINGVPCKTSSSYAVYLPKGMSHGPLKWYETRRPHIEMAIMLGAGTWDEAWGDSGLSPAG